MSRGSSHPWQHTPTPGSRVLEAIWRWVACLIIPATAVEFPPLWVLALRYALDVDP